MARAIVTQADIERGLRDVGVHADDVVFFHSSLSAFGYVVGGADAVIEAFLTVVGPTGTVVVPTFTLEDRVGEFGSWWDPTTTPSTVGLITNVFWRRPEARRSDHPIHSVAAIGPLAERITRVHLHGDERPSPWNGSYNVGGPFDHLYELDARYLLVGTSFMVQTMCHYVEQLLVEECLRRAADTDPTLAAELRGRVSDFFRPGGIWPSFNRIRMGERLLELGFWRRSQIGDAQVYLADTQSYVRTVREFLLADPTAWFNRDFLDWYARVLPADLRSEGVNGRDGETEMRGGVETEKAKGEAIESSRIDKRDRVSERDASHHSPVSPPSPISSSTPPSLSRSMVRVSAGWFIQGSLSTDPEARSDELPQRLVFLDEYVIDRFPVTEAEYARFVDATGHRPPPHWRDGRPTAGREDRPVAGVDWFDAVAYAAWAGKRLPTEAEWEKAARGGLSLNGADETNPIPWRRYPWGDAFDPARSQTSQSPAWDIVPIGRYSPVGDSPYGIADLAGNISEWVADWYAPDAYRLTADRNPTGPLIGTQKVLRGGGCNVRPTYARCASRIPLSPSQLRWSIGFRCARNR